ncbi:MAG: ferritin family protein [Chitinophagales bacterium]
MNRRSKDKCPPYDDYVCPETNQALETSMRGEAAAIKFYAYLAEMAPDQDQRETILKIRNDEIRHLKNFQAAYCCRTGCTYHYPEPNVEPPRSYCDGLQQAFNDEQEAYEFYKINMFCNEGRVKKAYNDALLDEAEHGRWFNNLLIRNGCMHKQHEPQPC